MAEDGRWMGEAVALAWQGLGSTYPNPCVGALVLDATGEPAGRAHTAPTGGPHAEVRALRAAGPRARGGTLYVTLEPCAHRGRTPPCTDAILAAGVARVVVGIEDPAPHVAGAGLARLREAGVEVELGTSAAACRRVHEHYLHHVATGRPFITLKAAVTLDGRIATHTGDSKWITGEPARAHAHRERARHHAILVGAATVRADDPALTVRLAPGTDPERVILDPRLSLVAPGEPVRAALRPGTRVFHGPDVAPAAREALARTGAEAVEVPAAPGGIDVAAVFTALGRQDVRSVLVEGGGRVWAACVAARCYDRLLVYTAPRLLGEGRPLLPGLTWPTVAAAPPLRVESRELLGDDILTVLRPG